MYDKKTICNYLYIFGSFFVQFAKRCVMLTLLILEDDEQITENIELLAKGEFLNIDNVLKTKEGSEASRCLALNKVDFAIVDVNIKKFDAITFTKKTKQLYPNIKIILCASFEYLDYAISALEIGADEYILKPLSRTDIIDVLTKVIDIHKGEKSNLQLSNYISPSNTKQEMPDKKKTGIANYLHDHIADPTLSLSSMAQLFGFSDGYFGQLFKKLFRTTFRAYILDLRLEKSKILLLSTQWKNYEIAAAIGIQDPNYFSTCFKRKYKMTTTQFRESQSNEATQANSVG